MAASAGNASQAAAMAAAAVSAMLSSTVGSADASAAAAVTPDPEWRQELNDLKTNMDAFFVISCSFIIFFMQTGFAFLEAGSVRSKNTTNILMKNTLDLLIGGIAYWAFGHAFAFSDGNPFIGYHHFFAANMEGRQYAKWFYGFCFASTSSTIVSGAVAERCSFVGYLTYTTVISGLVYPTVAHWVWASDGWLAATPFKDFGGTGVVHMTGGTAALVSCLILGPRLGLFDPVTKRKRVIRGHSVPLASLGCFVLLFGFLAFNTSSLGRISEPGDGERIGLAVINTVLSGAAGGLAALMYRRAGFFLNEKYERANWSFLLTVNGAFVGMVSVCAGCDSYRPWMAVVVGSVAAAAFLNGRRLTGACKYIDDPLDTVPVHFCGSWWGLIAAGIFSKDGLISGNGQVLMWNVIGGLSIVCWSATMIGTLFLTLRLFKIHRVTEEEEINGLDMTKHHEPAYPLEAWIDDPYCFAGHQQQPVTKNWEAAIATELDLKKDPRADQKEANDGGVVVSMEPSDLNARFHGNFAPTARVYYNATTAAARMGQTRRQQGQFTRMYSLQLRPSCTIDTLIEEEATPAVPSPSSSSAVMDDQTKPLNPEIDEAKNALLARAVQNGTVPPEIQVAYPGPPPE